jgi:predicted RNA-binding protein YlqC (UPF0109 family)
LLADWPLDRTRDGAQENPMKELVEYIARALVENPDQVRVTQVIGEQSIILELQVARDDMGKIIGKEGRIANAIRTLLKVAAAKQGKRAVLEIL